MPCGRISKRCAAKHERSHHKSCEGECSSPISGDSCHRCSAYSCPDSTGRSWLWCSLCDAPWNVCNSICTECLDECVGCVGKYLYEGKSDSVSVLAHFALSGPHPSAPSFNILSTSCLLVPPWLCVFVDSRIVGGRKPIRRGQKCLHDFNVACGEFHQACCLLYDCVCFGRGSYNALPLTYSVCDCVYHVVGCSFQYVRCCALFDTISAVSLSYHLLCSHYSTAGSCGIQTESLNTSLSGSRVSPLGMVMQRWNPTRGPRTKPTKVLFTLA